VGFVLLCVVFSVNFVRASFQQSQEQQNTIAELRTEATRLREENARLQTQLNERRNLERLIVGLTDARAELGELVRRCADISERNYLARANQITQHAVDLLSQERRVNDAQQLADGKLPPGGRFFGGLE